MALASTCRENGEIVISSGNRLTIENVGEFARLVREGLEASQQVSVEFEPEIDIDITGIQVLCSACKTAAASGKTFSCSGPRSRALAEVIRACGAERHAVCTQNNNSTCRWFGGVE